jgi:hypothetical protein
MLWADGSSDMSSRADAEKDGRHLDSIYQLVLWLSSIPANLTYSSSSTSYVSTTDDAQGTVVLNAHEFHASGLWVSFL